MPDEPAPVPERIQRRITGWSARMVVRSLDGAKTDGLEAAPFTDMRLALLEI